MTATPRILTINDQPITIRRCIADEVLPLRWRILRFGLAFDEARFDGDALPTSHHFAAFEPSPAGPAPVCCATFMRSDWQVDNTREPAWQLRGMATDARYQGQGVGTAVLQLAEQTVLAAGEVRLLWCNARVPALKFYERQGWTVMSDQFDSPTAGPHRKMIKRG